MHTPDKPHWTGNTMDEVGSEPGFVFHVISEAGELADIVESFLDHLKEIFAHVKNEIVDFCESLGMPVLFTIRNILFNDLSKMYSLENFELVERRKVSCLADEVYVMGFSKINKMMHHRLIRLLKPKFQKSSEKSESVNDIEDNESRNLSNGELFATILNMKQTISEYNIRFTDLTKWVTYLEVELTKQRCIKCDDLTDERRKSQVDNVVCTENILDTYEQTLPEKADAPIDSSKKMKVIAEVHKRAPKHITMKLSF